MSCNLNRIRVEIDFEIDGRSYSGRANEYGFDKKPSYFVQLLKYATAMHLAVPVTDQISKAQHWERITFGNPAEGGRGGYFRQAAATDGMGTGTQFIQDFPIVDTRLTLS